VGSNDLTWLDTLPPEAQAALLTSASQELRERKLDLYRPYPKQREFHAKGAACRERLLRAGNQNGKTYCVAAEMAYHLTGLYPEDWEGRRFDRPIVGWASSETGESTRDNPQRALMGLPGEDGTGAIPKRHLGLSPGFYGMAMGVADLYDFIRVRHHTNGRFDGWSMLRFKYYAQGRRKWQGPPVDFVWFDEEPPEDIYDEGLARTIATGGMVALSFTPLLGMSEVVRRYLVDPTPERSDTNMTIDDAEHIPVEERAKIIASFPAHEREARAKGIPTLGSGRIFPVEESSITESAFILPKHWPRICGIDFGWDHPTAAVWGAWDRDNDVVHLYDAYRVREQPVVVHAAAIKARGQWIPCAWPHDGLQHDKGAGIQLAEQYREQGVNMCHEMAQFPESDEHTATSRVSVEAGIAEMLDRMLTGRLKVAAHLDQWFEEFRLYHRKDGKIVKEYDDLLSATRYLLMMLRYAITQPDADTKWRERGRASWRTA
jgi:phage terminase large subunit-like protein